MIGLGTIVNAGAIILGGVSGTFIKNGLPQRYKDIVMQAIGLAVLMVGIGGTLQGTYLVVSGGKLDRQYTMIMIFSLVIGGLIGEFLDIEGKLEKMGRWFQDKFAKGSGTFAEGFVTASLIYCVGAMAIVGSLEDGLTGNASTLFAKSILDGVSAVVFAATLGIGVAFSALPILLYQGGITLLAGFIKPWLTDIVITQMSMVGSILIMAIGMNMLEIKKIKVGNLLPAIFIPFVYYLITNIFKL
ncbi:MAG: DUF554 domain-containing protein [Clostridia bacterium]|nr:DUF554 domain-containing protein [Clostridia bacterium]